LPRSRRHYRSGRDAVGPLGDAIAAHERATSRFGGLPNIHDIGLIESAVDRPYNGYHRPIHRKAAALLHAVATNHGFVDGNKRTALTLFYLLLDQSGYEFRKTSTRQDEDDIEHLILDVTTRFLSYEELIGWLRVRIHKT
jgi:death-on-curing protein